MPTDAELRTLFHDAPAPRASLNAATIIRRSKRRRLPQQVGAGSALTLAVAGIGVASINGLQGLAPVSTSGTMADAPVAESWGGADGSVADSGASPPRADCQAGPFRAAELSQAVAVAPAFPATAPTGGTVAGQLNLVNTSAQRIVGTVASPTVTLRRDGRQLDGQQLRYRTRSSAGTGVDLMPGESISLAFSFDAVQCDAQGEATGAPLEPGDYTLVAVLELRPDAGASRLVGGPASVIALR